MALFDAPENLSGWYDLDFYRRLAELMHAILGGRPERYFSEQEQKARKEWEEENLVDPPHLRGVG